MNGSLVVRETSAEAIGEMAIMADVNVLKPLLIKTTGDDDNDISYYMNMLLVVIMITLIVVTILIIMIMIKIITSIHISHLSINLHHRSIDSSGW